MAHSLLVVVNQANLPHSDLVDLFFPEEANLEAKASHYEVPVRVHFVVPHDLASRH